MSDTGLQHFAFAKTVETFFRNRPETNALQSAAYDRFVRQGLPHRRVEGWKWSDFNAAMRGARAANDTAPVGRIALSPFAALEPLELQIVDGRVLAPDAARLDGVAFRAMDPMATIPDLESHGIVNLNVAMAEQAIGVTVQAGVSLKKPILIRHIRTREHPAFCKVLMRICEGAEAALIETFEGAGAGFMSHLAHVDVRENARLQRYVLDQGGDHQVCHSMFAVKIDKGASFTQSGFSAGGHMARYETLVHCCEAGASVRIDSAALLSGERHADFTTHVLHKAPHCKVRQHHKGVAKDHGRAVFQGKFEVERAAQKTDAQMAANALLLSDGAEANHKPELEIYADDVECAHGSTVGALDNDALFYLRQRGLSETQARALLIEAFVGEVVDGIDHDGVRAVFAAQVAAWLEQQQ